MWGKRKKRCAQLPRQLALGLLEDAMGQVQQQERDQDETEPVPYPGAAPAPESGSALPGRDGLRTADVAVDNSAGPGPWPASDDPPPPQHELPAPRTAENTHHGTFG